VDFGVSAHRWGWQRDTIHAIQNLDLIVNRGETLAIVGESGSGKTTLGRAMIGLQQPTAGTIRIDGTDITSLHGQELRRFRRRIQMVFQDPYSSLNSRMRIRDIIEEPLRAQGIGTRKQRQARVEEMIALVGLPPNAGDRYPHAFSGGQRQRIGIARALSVEPELVVADEPVSALDVSIQAQVLNLLIDLRERLRLTLVFIAHDLAVVRQIATRVAVMYLGRIVEVGPAAQIFDAPRHPYTKVLLGSVPIPHPRLERARNRIVLTGEAPSPVNPPSGCQFHPRCPVALPVCSVREPRLLGPPAHLASCHLANPDDSLGLSDALGPSTVASPLGQATVDQH
jgi:oligopeptide/dipeptide ABC transporter ATP-binding protein